MITINLSPVTHGQKWCKRGRHYADGASFYRHKVHGLSAWCVGCTLTDRRLRYPSIAAQRSALRRREHLHDPRLEMLSSARRRARRDGVPFALSLDDVEIPGRCPILGIELRVADGKPAPHSPTIDRVSPALGYVAGNVHVISHRANRIKNDATEEELEMVLAYVKAGRSS